MNDSERSGQPSQSGADQTKPPDLSETAITALCQKLFKLEARHIKQLNSYDDRNYHIITENGQKFVLKVTNSEDSALPGLLEGQNEMIIHLDQQNFHVPSPIKNIYGQYVSRQSLSSLTGSKTDHSTEQCSSNSANSTCSLYAVRLFRFVEGIRLCDIEIDSELLTECGHYLARLNLALVGFQNQVIKERKFLWSLENVPQLRKYLYVFDDEIKRKTMADCIDQFESGVLSLAHQLDHGFIHGDFNEQNILIVPNQDNSGHKVHGVIDFGDISYSVRFYDLAILIAYIMLINTTIDPVFEAPNLVLKGYRELIPLKQKDIEIILICAKARICQSLVLGAYTFSQYPENEYLLVTAKTGWKILQVLCQADSRELIAKWSQ